MIGGGADELFLADRPLVYYVGAEAPDAALTWLDSNRALIDFSNVGYTFEAKIGRRLGTAATVTKTTGFVGAATAPNLTITWATSGDLNSLDAGRWLMLVSATLAGKVRRSLWQVVVAPIIT